MAKKLKGNLIAGQSGGPTAVINNSLCGVIQEAQKHSDIENIYGMVHGIQGLLEENIIDLGRQKAGVIEGLRSTPSAALGSCRYKLQDEDYEKILHIFKSEVRLSLQPFSQKSPHCSHQFSPQNQQPFSW